MNRIAIFLRKELKKNRFSEAVVGALNDQAIDEAVLCSGFFQEDASYSVSKAKFDLTSRCPAPLDLKVVGYYGWQKHSYPSFLNGLTGINCPKCVTITGFRIPGNKWHAKICIAKKGGLPVFAAIGSSNITKRAFDTLSKFNYESDVIFWDETDPTINATINNAIGDVVEEFPAVIVADYDQRHPANRHPVKDRLIALEKEIFAKAKQLP